MYVVLCAALADVGGSHTGSALTRPTSNQEETAK
jgi:hypothetical protein